LTSPTLLTRGQLSDDENDLMKRLMSALRKRRHIDERLSAYYEGSQRIEHLGIAIPPSLRRFETVVNWPRMVVDELERRLDVKSIYLPDEDADSESLREAWEVNNLASEIPLLNKEKMILGRGFVSVGTNEDDDDHPLITVEPPRQMACTVDQRRRRMVGAVREYRDWDGTHRRTLYLPDATVWLSLSSKGWVVDDRDDHDLGKVPVVLFLNRRRLGDWWGTSEMADVIPLTDSAVRTLTNLQVASESHAVPTRYALGLAQGDFVDSKTGEPLPVWEAYFTSFMATKNKDAKIGQLDASDLRNFHETVTLYAQLVSSVTGLPLRYFAQSTVNPAAEGAIRAEETRWVKNAERQQVSTGDGLGWIAALYERFRTGEWIDGNRIKVEWHDAGTPTFAQKVDGVSKLNGGKPVLSREGSWDELGWDPKRKDRERGYFEKEARDPQIDDVMERIDMRAKQITGYGTAVRAGAKNDAAAEVMGLPPIEHTGRLPVTVQDEDTPASRQVNGQTARST
jgi:hypothetical protein